MPEGRAPAKAILLGEHFVVHGAPALAVPVTSLSLVASVSPAPVPAPIDGHLGYCVETLLASLGQAGLPVVVRIESSIPVGAGLGSSAALSIALARALAKLCGQALDPDQLRQFSMRCEQQAHGKPSGIDTEVCMTERPVWAEPGLAFSELQGAGLEAVGMVVLHTGPGGQTAEMISLVDTFRRANGKRFDQLAAASRQRAFRAREALLAGDAAELGILLTEQHGVLHEIGVSTPALDGAVEAALKAGARGAKLSGAGGGGVAVAVAAVDEVERVATALLEAGQQVLAAGPVGVSARA